MRKSYIHLRRIHFGVLFLLATAAIPGASALDLKFDDLERMTREGNSSIEAFELQWHAQEKRTGFFWKSFMPRFDLIGGWESFQTGVYPQRVEPYGAVSASVSLFNGFRDLNEERLRKAQAILTKVDSAVETNETLSRARQLYLQLAYCKELEATYKAILETNDKARKSAQVRQNRGLVTSTDLYEFDIYGSRLREEIESLRHERELLSIKLAAVLGMEERRDINPLDTLGHEHHEELLNTDFSNLPTAGRLKIEAQDSVRQAEASFRASWWMPSVEAYTGYYVYTFRDRDYFAFQDRDDWAVGVRATWALFNFELFSQSSAAALEEKASAKATKQRSIDFRAEVATKKGELIHLHELIHNSEERLKLGESYLKSTQNDYDRGVKNSPDVISAIEKMITIRKELLERKLEYHRTRDRLATLTQKL